MFVPDTVGEILYKKACNNDWKLIKNELFGGIYFNIKLISRFRNSAKISILIDGKKENISKETGSVFHSQIVQHEYECQLKKSRVLAITRYKSHMAEGDAEKSKDGEGSWEQIEPSSMDEYFMKLACGLS